MPSYLCVLEAGGSNLDQAGFPFAVLLEEDKPKSVDACVRHGMECVPLFEWLQVLQLHKVLYDVVELLLMVFSPTKLDTFVRQAPELVCGHGIIWAELAQI